MTIYETIRSHHTSARKSRNDEMRDVLTTLIGELDLKAEVVGSEKVVTDATAISVIKKFLKNLQEVKDIEGPQKMATKTDFEIMVLERYLPKQLTEVELRSIIGLKIVDGMPAVMKFLKDTYPGLYDGKVASTIAKELSTV